MNSRLFYGCHHTVSVRRTTADPFPRSAGRLCPRSPSSGARASLQYWGTKCKHTYHCSALSIVTRHTLFWYADLSPVQDNSKFAPDRSCCRGETFTSVHRQHSGFIPRRHNRSFRSGYRSLSDCPCIKLRNSYRITFPHDAPAIASHCM
jgi:hypothetical protein